MPRDIHCLLDSGASVDCKPHYLEQFAENGFCLCGNRSRHEKNPAVSTFANIGVEREKGNALVKEAYSLLENWQTLILKAMPK